MNKIKDFIKDKWAVILLIIVISISLLVVVPIVIEEAESSAKRMNENLEMCKELGYDDYNDFFGECSKKEYNVDGYSYNTKYSGTVDFEKYKAENWK